MIEPRSSRRAQPDEASKPAYVPPAVAWEEPFEVQANSASACGKVLSTDGGGCVAVQSS